MLDDCAGQRPDERADLVARGPLSLEGLVAQPGGLAGSIERGLYADPPRGVQRAFTTDGTRLVSGVCMQVERLGQQLALGLLEVTDRPGLGRDGSVGRAELLRCGPNRLLSRKLQLDDRLERPDRGVRSATGCELARPVEVDVLAQTLGGEGIERLGDPGVVDAVCCGLFERGPGGATRRLLPVPGQTRRLQPVVDQGLGGGHLTQAQCLLHRLRNIDLPTGQEIAELLIGQQRPIGHQRLVPAE